MKPIYTLFFALLFSPLFSQTNVRAWYADGQVWVVWNIELPLPETYAVYASPTPFTNTDDAVLVGRLFPQEYLGGALKEQVDTSATFRIPDGSGGIYPLSLTEGLFVATPHQAGALYIAVVAWGQTSVTPGINGTENPVSFDYDPVNDPVECHLQASFPAPNTPGFICFAYSVWVDGRQNHWENRPDFPVMGNAAKNGMPALFMVSVPTSIDTSQAAPLTVWLHGGGGTAQQSLAGRRTIVNIDPAEGFLVAHNDDVVGYRIVNPPSLQGPSWHFGYRKNWNPFAPNLPTMQVDTVVNYTQRRYLWVDSWLTRTFNIDTNRININGHSMGAAGTNALTKCNPRHYASATLHNNGFGGPESGESNALFGDPASNPPTNLINRAGEVVRFLDVWNLIDNCSPERDLPLIRSYHSKNDEDGVMKWDELVIENYRAADSLGMGIQLLWSERAHGIDTGPDWNDHWLHGDAPDQQTNYDNTAFEEAHFRKDSWLPAFTNHRLEPANNDPGDGTPGTGPNSSGDDWGSWGGYHRWAGLQIGGNSGAPSFSGIFWLEDGAIFPNDNCPNDSLTADLFIRNLLEGISTSCTTASWVYILVSLDDNYNTAGMVECVDGEILVLRNVKLFRKGIRRLALSVQAIVPTSTISATGLTARVYPNPAIGNSTLEVDLPEAGTLSIRLLNSIGVECKRQTLTGQQGENQIPLELDGLEPGMYYLDVSTNNVPHTLLKLVKK
ncbi:MAG: T9SS type A sorting domain-containing protein [Saprospiraceae bacterium]